MAINLFNLLTIPRLSWPCICPWSTSRHFRSLSVVSCSCQGGLSRSPGDPGDRLFCFCLLSCLVSLLRSASSPSNFPWFAFLLSCHSMTSPAFSLVGLFWSCSHSRSLVQISEWSLVSLVNVSISCQALGSNAPPVLGRRQEISNHRQERIFKKWCCFS